MTGNHNATLYLLSDKTSNIEDINISTENGLKPLHCAIYYNFSDIIELLLQRGASVNIAMKSNGMTSVHLACFHNRVNCLSILINSKDAFYGQSEAGFSPSQIAITHSSC